MAMDLSSVFGMSIGKDTSNKFKLSLNGLAVQVSDNSYVTYDHKKDELSQAIIFDFGGAANSVFRVPVPLPDVKKGDIILASDNPLTVYFVVDDPQKGTKELKVVTPTGNRTTFSPTNNPFATGAAFVVVVTSLFGRAGGDFSLEKLLPLLVLSDTKGTAGGGGDDLLTTLTIANALGLGGSRGLLGAGNPLSLLALGKGSNLGALALLLGSSSGQPAPPAPPSPPTKP